MAIKIIDYGSIAYDQMIELRKSVLRKPLGLTYSKEDLERDQHDLLIGAFEDDEILACCILTKKDPDTFQLRQMAVDQRMQRNGVGAAIMHFAENLAKDSGGRDIMMHARQTELGYTAEGDEFSEVGIPHVEMRKSLI
jgi:predicted GNAT family N-acyltransferase